MSGSQITGSYPKTPVYEYRKHLVVGKTNTHRKTT